MHLTIVAAALASFALGASAQSKVTGSSAQPCPNPPNNATVQAYVDIEVTDTQATLFRDDARAEFVLAFPGSNGTHDSLTDYAFLPIPYRPEQCPGCAVHVGFYVAWTSAADAVRAQLDAALAARPGYGLVLGGGSLGAALANLAFAELRADPRYVGLVRAVYNSGQPRVGNQAYADYVDALAGASDTAAGIFHRTTHADDGVPQMPPVELGFRHSGTEYWESEMEATAATTYRCFGQEPDDCNLSQESGGQFINDAHTSYAGYETATCSGS
ncbi:hypothetical protein SLS62_000355 [Diatrype stigma]|uniref:Fungal lipase-type domain-containing protein n=1 Tax=Diatrype stigma TaxID=117547 RepID=A0AAN9VC09_9PEZI